MMLGDRECRSTLALNQETTGRELVICGAAPDTGNLGVSALLYSAMFGLHMRMPDTRMAVLDYGDGLRKRQIAGQTSTLAFCACGARNTKRVWKPESWRRIHFSAHTRLPNPVSTLYRNAIAVLDVSGGDSFTDLYGTRRFDAIVAPKRFALKMRKPLILLPQTYGPFNEAKSRKTAERIVRQAEMAWARDERSYRVLRELLGSEFDGRRHRRAVDMAFGLESQEPSADVLRKLRLADRQPARAVGINVSGLIFNDPASAVGRYGFKADYGEVIKQIIRRILKESDSRVFLIPHVVSVRGHYESDISACEAICRQLARESNERITVVEPLQDPRQVKWVISRMEWFCGTRMHSAIAALSSGVPTTAIAYSPKTIGVFETCGQGSRVADPCALSTCEMVEHLWRSWEQRSTTCLSLAAALPNVLKQTAQQMNQLTALLVELAERQNRES